MLFFLFFKFQFSVFEAEADEAEAVATVGGGRRCESGLMSCEAEEEAAEARVSASRTFMLRYTLIIVDPDDILLYFSYEMK